MNDNAIRRIQVGDLRKMSDREGLILQGCGGDPQEWLDGINEMLAVAGILRNGSRFERASLFEYQSVEAVRKKFINFFENRLNE